jgi:DNA repair protein RadC
MIPQRLTLPPPIAGPLGISLHDHTIVGKNGHASLKGLRLI